MPSQTLPPPPQFQSPPGSGGNDGALPTTYDSAWPTYVNLTQAQIAAFSHFPADLLAYAHHRRWEAQVGLGRPGGALPNDATLGQIASTVVQLFVAHRQLLPKIVGAAVTTRAQIDAIYAPIAPNSPSATNPSSI